MYSCLVVMEVAYTPRITMDEETALAWGQDYANPCSKNPLIAVASCAALLLGGVFFLLGLGLFMLLDQTKRLLG